MLEVLVGKALEAARFELILEDEMKTLHKDKETFKQRREAMLVQTQRLEAERNRRNGEIGRRNLEKKTQQQLLSAQEKKEMAKNVTHQFLLKFKRDNLNYLQSIGILRDRKEYQLNTIFLPLLRTQVEVDYYGNLRWQDELSQMVLTAANKQTSNHKVAIAAEMKRRKDKAAEEKKQRDLAAAAQARRRQRRAALREQARIGNLQEMVLYQIKTAPQVEYTTQMKVYDVRDYSGETEGSFVIGGFIGELILFFVALDQCIKVNPKDENFRFGYEEIQRFITEILPEDYPENIAVLETFADLGDEVEPSAKAELVTKTLLDLQNSKYSSFGQRIFFEYVKRNCSMQVLYDVLKAICMVHYTKEKELF